MSEIVSSELEDPRDARRTKAREFVAYAPNATLSTTEVYEIDGLIRLWEPGLGPIFKQGFDQLPLAVKLQFLRDHWRGLANVVNEEPNFLNIHLHNAFLGTVAHVTEAAERPLIDVANNDLYQPCDIGSEVAAHNLLIASAQWLLIWTKNNHCRQQLLGILARDVGCKLVEIVPNKPESKAAVAPAKPIAPH